MPNASFWLELKTESDSGPTLRPQQAAWHLREASNGGLSYVICDFPKAPYLRIWKGLESALAGSAGMLCVRPLIEANTVAEALRLLLEDALRQHAARSSASSR